MPINSKPHIHNLVICSNVFVRKDGSYLLLKRSPLKKYAPNFIHPIGGKVDSNENPLTGAQRELLEEAGIKIKNTRLEAIILEIKPLKDEEENWLIFYFPGDYESGELLKTEEGEFIFIDENEVEKQNLFPSVRPIIKHILNPKDGTEFFTLEYDGDGNIIKETQKIDLCAV